MYIGKRIRQLRLKNKLSQEELVKGIISISHLSNLEAGRYSASLETIEFLAERLKVKTNDYLLDCFTIDQELKIKLNQLFTTIISDVDNVSQIIKSINLPINCMYQEWTYFYLLCSYYYKINWINEARRIEKEELTFFITESDLSSNELPDYLKQAYYYYEGISSYRNKRLKNSYTFFNKLLEYIHSDRISADIQYNLALISYIMSNYLKAKKYADLTKEYHIKKGNIEKLAIIYNLLATIYCDNSLYDDALKKLNKSMKITKYLKINYLEYRIMHNTGLAYKGLKDYSKALEYFLNSYKLKSKLQTDNILITTLEIIKCHLFLGQYVEAKKLAKTSSQFLISETDCHLLSSLKGNIDLFEGNTTSFISKKTEALDFFTNNNLNKNAKGIAKELGDYYFKINKYKNAAIYYEKEFNLLNENKGGD